MDVAEIRQAARASGCRVVDILADEELDNIIMTIVMAAEACGFVMVQQQWSIALPSTASVADLPVGEPVSDVFDWQDAP
jgi:hypothetical protein